MRPNNWAPGIPAAGALPAKEAWTVPAGAAGSCMVHTGTSKEPLTKGSFQGPMAHMGASKRALDKGPL